MERSGCTGFGRRSDGASERRRFKKNRRRERYEVRDDDGRGRRTCFSAEKPRRLQRATGTLPRAAFQVLLFTRSAQQGPGQKAGPLLWSNRLKHLLPPETNHRIRKDHDCLSFAVLTDEISITLILVQAESSVLNSDSDKYPVRKSNSSQ